MEPFGPLHSVTQTVGDLDRAVTFYQAALGLEVAGTGTMEGARWLMPDGVDAEYCELAAPSSEEGGRLRLVECSVSGERVRDPSRVQDPGWFAVNFRADDVRLAWERAIAAGANPKSPVRIVSDAEFEGGNRVLDSQFYDPDGAIVDVFELAGPIEQDVGTLEAQTSPIQTMAIRCASIERSKAFYGRMGFEVWYDHEIRDRNDFFQIPDGTWLHNVNLMHRSHPLGRVELAAIVGWTGDDISLRHRPPNIGYLWITLPVGSVAAAVDVLGTPALAADRDHAFVTGPDGELVELALR